MSDVLPAVTWKAHDWIEIPYTGWWLPGGLYHALRNTHFKVAHSTSEQNTLAGADAVYSEYNIDTHAVVNVRLKTEAVRLWAMMNTRSVDNVGP